MTDDWRVVFESRNRAACSDRALVLASIEIPHELVHDQAGCALIVPAEFSGDAARELRLYDEENPVVAPKRPPVINYHNPVPGIFGYLTIICVVAFFANNVGQGDFWRTAGRVDGELIRMGEWWRLVTALTLHSGLKHIAGNIVFGTLFGLFAGRLLGSGVGWLAIVVCAATGNLVNTMLLEWSHRSIGASTAVFAALGLVAGFVWRAKLMSQERWPYRLGPIIGGAALLMYTGTGGANTDVGAHLFGFICGFAGGMLLTRFRAAIESQRVQLVSGATATALVLLAWFAALSVSKAPAIM